MDLDKILESINRRIGKIETLCSWELKTGAANLSEVFSFKSSYKISRILKKDKRIKVIIDVEWIDDESWRLLQETTQKIFSRKIREQLVEQSTKTEDFLDIMTEEGELL
jgi:hypothetical protein